jgi:hypothetical protein
MKRATHTWTHKRRQLPFFGKRNVEQQRVVEPSFPPILPLDDSRSEANSLSIKSSNEYQIAYQQFLNTRLAQRLKDKFSVKPFHTRYGLLNVLAKGISYGLHVFGAATAFTCVFLFLHQLLQNSLWAGIFTTVFLFGLEVFKRLMIPDFCKNALQFRRVNWLKLSVIAALTTLSIALSYSGATATTELLPPSVFLTNIDSVKQSYQTRIATLENRLTDINQTQSRRGRLTTEGQASYKILTEQIALIESEMSQNVRSLSSENTVRSVQHGRKTAINAHYWGLFTLVLDLSLIGLLYFMEYYDFRSFGEFAQINDEGTPQYWQQKQPSKLPQNTNEAAVTTEQIGGVATESNGFDESILKLAIKSAKSNLTAYEAKLRNADGNAETNQKGIERWQSKLIELESLFKTANS